jgi:regulator of sigma E protease
VHYLDTLVSLIRSAAAPVVALGVLVFIHEMGHYLAARWCGVHVEAFSIGFGRAVAGWTDKHGTAWKLSWIPLGGYVKLHGQERPEEVADDVRALWQPGRTFHEKQVGKRAIIVAAGPIANFLLAGLLFGLLFAINGRPLDLPIVGEVGADTAASAAGIQKGDRIIQIDGAPVARFADLISIVSTHAGQPLSVLIHRGNADQTISVTPRSQDDGGGKQIGRLGIGSATEFVSIPVALAAGFMETWSVTEQTLVGVSEMITGHRGTEGLGGPLRIFQLSGEVAQLGIMSFLRLIALLSVNLGLINLFPIPILDGGHLLFYFFEAVRGRPLPKQALEYGFRAGLAVLVCLFVFATWNDLSHFGLMRWVAGLIG